jgi:hypothetical protein
MSIKILDSSRCEIVDSLNREDLKQILNSAALKTVQICSPITQDSIEILNNQLFLIKPDIEFRVYGHYSTCCDLSFLSRMNNLEYLSLDCLRQVSGLEVLKNLKKIKGLAIDIYYLESFDILSEVPETLERLLLGATKSKKPNLFPLERLANLKELYLEGQQKGIEVLSTLINLQDVTLRSITTDNLNYLVPLKKLWSLDIKLGGTKNISAITGMDNIKYLELWQIRGLSDISVITSLTGLQNLFLQSLPNVTKLPSFEPLKSLRRITLENMNGLVDISSLEKAPGLEEFIYCDASNMQPEDYFPLMKNPSLKMAIAGMGSIKKNKAFEKLCADQGISSAEWSEFNYI